MEDMIQVKLIVEGIKAEIVKAFDVVAISSAVRRATEKAVDEFDMKTFIQETVETVFHRAREAAIQDVAEKYSSTWSNSLSFLIDNKIEKALQEIKESDSSKDT